MTLVDEMVRAFSGEAAPNMPEPPGIAPAEDHAISDELRQSNERLFAQQAVSVAARRRWAAQQVENMGRDWAR